MVPAGGAHVAAAGAGVKAGVEAAPAAEHARAGIDDAVLGDEPLRGGHRGRVRQRVREVVLARHVAAAVGQPSALQEEHARALRQRRRQRAARRAAAHHDVVVVGHQRRVPRVPHEPEVVPLRCSEQHMHCPCPCEVNRMGDKPIAHHQHSQLTFRRGGDDGDAERAQNDGEHNGNSAHHVANRHGHGFSLGFC